MTADPTPASERPADLFTVCTVCDGEYMSFGDNTDTCPPCTPVTRPGWGGLL